MPTKQRTRALPWKYCECGCHGSELRFGKSIYFWRRLYTDPDAGSTRSGHLYTEHGGLGGYLGTFKIHAEMDRFVRERAKPFLPRLREEVKHQRRRMAEAERLLKQAVRLFR